MLRLFAAVSLPTETPQALARRQTGIEGARWSPLENLHVTLRFFGEVREDVAADLDAELGQVDVRPFEITLQGAGSFGDGEDLNAVWAGVAESAELRRLAGACETAARRAGLKADKRNYRPHVTLAYLRRADPAEVGAWIQANNLLKSPPIPVEDFKLYASTLGREGSSYRVLAEYPL